MLNLNSLITSQTRLKMLLKFFANPHTSSYLRSLASEFNESTNSIRVELNNLSNAGYLVSKENGRTIAYSANTHHQIYPELRSLVHKYFGLDKIVESVVQRLGTVHIAIITGDYAEGKDSGIIDLVMVGDINKEKLRKYAKKVETLVKRKINTLVLTIDEFNGYRKSLNLDKAIWLWNDGRGVDMYENGGFKDPSAGRAGRRPRAESPPAGKPGQKPKSGKVKG